MVNYEAILRRFLANRGDSSLPIESMNGSSDNKIFRVGGYVYRLGRVADIQADVMIYRRFSKCGCVFPRLELMESGKHTGVAIVKMLYLGQSFETLLLSVSDNSVVGNLVKVNRVVLRALRSVHNKTTNSNTNVVIHDNQLFFQELITALMINLGKAGLTEEGFNFLRKTEKSLAHLIGRTMPSRAHRDLSVGNIIVSQNIEEVHFIDPRAAVPYAETSEAIGNVVIDISGYLVSVQRKDMEIQRSSQSISLQNMIDDVTSEIKEYQRQEIFCTELLHICTVLWYSVYAACKCPYCTAPERRWLYDIMVERLRLFLQT